MLKEECVKIEKRIEEMQNSFDILKDEIADKTGILAWEQPDIFIRFFRRAPNSGKNCSVYEVEMFTDMNAGQELEK